MATNPIFILTILPFIFINLFFTEINSKEIYFGKQGSWKIYYSPEKVPKVIEIGGIKYGSHDILTDVDEKDTIAKSNDGTLYYKNNHFWYRNEKLNINVKLKRMTYSDKIDYQRLKIFEINAFNEISALKRLSNNSNYEFDWNVRQDYEYYRDHATLPTSYKPLYIKKYQETQIK